jgi:hypothetical protein
MNAHISDDLPLLLTGEATRAEVTAAGRHLRDCPDCQQDLVAAVVAHASLTSARRFAPEMVAGASAIRSASASSPRAATTLPDLEAVFAQARADAATPLARPRRRRRTALLAVAAAVIVGGTATGIALSSSGSPSGHTVALAAYGVGATRASARFSGDQLRVDATHLPTLDAAHRYEVWLTNDARTRMQPVGWVDNGGVAKLTVPGSLAAAYRDIEVSVQQVDAPSYDYSGISVLRGSYA